MLRKFLTDKSGNFAMMTAIATVPLLGGLALAIDFTEVSRQRQETMNALDAAGIATARQVVTGASDDEVRSAKADVVAEALDRLVAFGSDITRPVLVGDRHHDVLGAAEHDVPTVFVRWGYGAPAEEVGSIAVVDTPAQLQRRLLGG